MWRTAFTLIQVWLYCVQINLVESWKMKVCLNGTVYEIQEYKCRTGVWFAEPKRVSTICFEKGMWAIYRDWCDQNPIIWTVHPETKGCMTQNLLQSKILGIIYLGRHETGGLISTTSHRLFLNNKELRHGKKLEFLDANEIEILTWGSSSFSLEQKDKYSNYEKCLIKGKDSFFGYYNFELKERFNVSVHLGENRCIDRSFRGTRTQVLPKLMDFEIHQNRQNSWDDFKCEPHSSRPEINDNEDFSVQDEDPAEIIQQKVDQQSQRIGLKLYARQFIQEGPPDMEFEEWKFLELAVDIFKKTCPKGMVSEFYLDNVFILFQFLINESFNIFPPTIDRDDDSRLRIWTALKRCEANATTLTFKNHETCSKASPLLKFQYQHGGTVLRLIEIPRPIKINVEKFDLILESTWKLMVFIHYYCAESFKFNTDLSVLQNRWQALLAPDIIRRWKNPGRSYGMMQQIFMSINLTRTIKNMDYCVGAAHMQSVYKGWLKRPLTKWESRGADVSNKEDLIWDNHAFCVDDFAYPAEKLGYPIEKCGVKYTD